MQNQIVKVIITDEDEKETVIEGRALFGTIINDEDCQTMIVGKSSIAELAEAIGQMVKTVLRYSSSKVISCTDCEECEVDKEDVKKESDRHILMTIANAVAEEVGSSFLNSEEEEDHNANTSSKRSH